MDGYTPISQETIQAVADVLKQERESQEAYWNTLTKDQQLSVFCHVVRQLSTAELDDHRSYRGILYDVFGFGPESYSLALAAGFMDLHNAIPLEHTTDASKPVAWMFQHDETGRTTCIDNQQVEWGWHSENPRWNLVCPLYATPHTNGCVSNEGAPS